MTPDERARERRLYGLSISSGNPGSFQRTVSASGYNEKQKHLGAEELDPLEFKDLLKEKKQIVEMEAAYVALSQRRFFRCEKKRNEILQMAVLDPSFGA